MLPLNASESSSPCTTAPIPIPAAEAPASGGWSWDVHAMLPTSRCGPSLGESVAQADFGPTQAAGEMSCSETDERDDVLRSNPVSRIDVAAASDLVGLAEKLTEGENALGEDGNAEMTSPAERRA
eukprot:TRINITY_DN56080_c0_g1_i1.p2 TRINITY_DN56080_c0_g1~~TRINITY_DN56080_c0_g1_i1.p2  ORF type:complete len:125 (+),score=8.81 TRINITY_DN56080_c0_g1_i1:368-742(+)